MWINLSRGFPDDVHGFPVDTKLRAHEENEHQNDTDLLDRKIEDDELKVKCTDCDLRFLEERFMKYHKERQHDSDLGARVLKYSCSSCEEKFISIGFKFAHEVTEHGSYLKDEKYECPLCYRSSPELKYLTEHFTSRHKADIALISKRIETKRSQSWIMYA